MQYLMAVSNMEVTKTVNIKVLKVMEGLVTIGAAVAGLMILDMAIIGTATISITITTSMVVIIDMAIINKVVLVEEEEVAIEN